MIGRRFGMLTVVKQAPSRANELSRRWECTCDCGNVTETRTAALNRGTTKSCGCLRHISTATHGQSRSRTYKLWCNMLQRAKGNSCPEYYSHIGVDPRWTDFAAFLLDMGEVPAGHSLDRIDNNAGYGPANCRWATQVQQIRNRRNTATIEYNGVTASVAEWAERSGLSYNCLWRRIRRGLPVSEALSRPFRYPPRAA